MRVVVLSNGHLGRHGFYRRAIGPDDVLICADGGANYAWALGLVPNMVIGDMDSIDPKVRSQLVADGTAELVTAPTDKDETDAELAVRAALARHPSELVLMGMLGGRLDHTIANIGLLAMVPEEISCYVEEPGTRVWLVRKELRFECAAGQTISIVPYGGSADGVTLKGMKYPLVNGTLSGGKTQGLSNVATRATASVSVKNGMLLVMLLH